MVAFSNPPEAPPGALARRRRDRGEDLVHRLMKRIDLVLKVHRDFAL